MALLEGNPAETANLAAALLNRCVVHLNARDVRRARPDAIGCQRVAAAGGHDRLWAKALHNLGYCDLLDGDIPAALERRSAPLVFAWLERSRAQAFLVRPVRPPADPQTATVLAELRQLSLLIWQAELNGGRDPRMIARQAELRREISLLTSATQH